MDDLHGVGIVGPLGLYARGFAAELARLGFAGGSARKQLGLAAYLSRWLCDAGLGVGDLATPVVGAFLVARRAAYRDVLMANPGSAPTTPPLCSSPPATTPTGSTARHPSPPCAASARWRRPPARPAVADSTAVATDKPTPRSTASPCAGCAGTPAPATTSPAASPKAKPTAKPSTASSDTSPAKSIGSSHPHPKRSPQLLDIHRGISAC